MKVEFLHTRLPLGARFVIAFFFYAFVALSQAWLVKGGSVPQTLIRFAGFGLFLIPLWFLKVRNFTNKPAAANVSKKAGAKTEGTWKPVAMTDLDRMRDRIAASKKAKIPAKYTLGIGGGLTFAAFFLLALCGIAEGAGGFFAILDLYLVFFPFLWFAQIEKWQPAISLNIDALSPVIDAKPPEKFRLSPMLLFSDEDKDQVPSDIRLMLAPSPDAPQELRDELLGVQFQLTFNTGPNGSVPYAYAVFITKGQGKIWQALKVIRFPSWVTEAGSSTEGGTVYGTVVLRLDTKSRSDGYHTRADDVAGLYNMVVQALARI